MIPVIRTSSLMMIASAIWRVDVEVATVNPASICRLSGRALALAAIVSLLAAATATAQSTPAQPAPLPNRLNESLPDWLRLRAEFRERMESIDGAGFASEQRDVYWLSRLRFNVSVTPASWLGFHAQVQDARVADKDIGTGGPPFSAPIDVRYAYVDLGTTRSPVSARIGRQELVFGDQRLVGHANWLNAARTFNAARVILRGKGVQLDAFAGAVVRIDPDDWDQSAPGNRFHGVDATVAELLPGGTIEPYFFWRADPDQRTESATTGRLQLGTTGVRAAGTLPAGFDYALESVIQRGSIGTDKSRAWAQHLRLRTPAIGNGVRLISDYNYASGDANPTDGLRGTFDPLYPTAHDKYGLADQVGWRNIHHLRAGAELPAFRGVPVSASYHTWWLASATDGLYLASGALLARIPAGAPSRHVGHEFDVQASKAIAPYLQVAGGYAYILPGDFLKAATPGQSFNSMYLTLTYVFLAER